MDYTANSMLMLTLFQWEHPVPERVRDRGIGEADQEGERKSARLPFSLLHTATGTYPPDGKLDSLSAGLRPVIWLGAQWAISPSESTGTKTHKQNKK